MKATAIPRRSFLRIVVGAAGAVAALPAGRAGAALVESDGPYGPLAPPDANGLRLPEGFTSRVVAAFGRPVAGTDHEWHALPDGGAVFASPDGDGWAYVSNSEMPDSLGGVGVLRFDAAGEVVDAYSVLEGTSRNCAGGSTPWRTWLSCEEVEGGLVWEVDPFDPDAARPLPALGRFSHEAAAVDPVREHVYLTEDMPDSRFYRFTPTAYPDLSAGLLEAMTVSEGGATTWVPVPDPQATRATTRSQVPGATTFDGGEGLWFDAGQRVYFTTKGDSRVWVHDVEAQTLAVVYEPAMVSEPAILTGLDNLTIASSGDLIVAEDTGAHELDLVIITPSGEIARLLTLVGHDGSELAGPAFTPDGDRLYVSSQRGLLSDDGTTSGGGFGVTYEIRGPFRPASAVAPTSTSTPATTSVPATTPATTAVTPSTVAEAANRASDGAGDDFPAVPVALGGAAAALVVAAVWLRRRGQAGGVS